MAPEDRGLLLVKYLYTPLTTGIQAIIGEDILVFARVLNKRNGGLKRIGLLI